MIATILVVFGGFTVLILRSYRQSLRSGRRFEPEGKLRWTEDSLD